MGIILRTADLHQDRDLLVSTLSRYLTPTSNHARFDWLYCQNPHGPAQAWLALDDKSGEIVGASAAFARRIMVKGTERAGWVLGDFCIADKYRSLGPALQLQKATLGEIQAMGAAGLCYDFPSRRLTAVYQRLGIYPAAEMIRLVKPLRLDRRLEQLFGSKILARPATLIGNVFLRLSNMHLGHEKGWEIGIHSGDCGEEFTALEKAFPNADHLEIQRSAEYLNWRYLRHPLIRHQVLTARKAGKLQGYVVFICHDEHAQIAEFRVGDDYRLLAALLRSLVQLLLKTRTMTLNAYLLSGDSRLEHLKGLGFSPRESNPMIAYGPACQEFLGCNWRLMYGDRDS